MGLNTNTTATLLMYCPDREGIIAIATQFINKHGGNIIYLEQHVDIEENLFFMRIVWELREFDIPKSSIRAVIGRVFANKYGVKFDLYFSDKTPRMAIFVSKMSHCLYDLLARYNSGDWKVEIPLILSNHPDMAKVAQMFDIPYFYVPVTKETKAEAEQKTLDILKEHEIDFVVLARYMQIISQNLLSIILIILLIFTTRSCLRLWVLSLIMQLMPEVLS